MTFGRTVYFDLQYHFRRLVSRKLLQLSFLWSQTAIKKRECIKGRSLHFLPKSEAKHEALFTSRAAARSIEAIEVWVLQQIQETFGF